MPKFIFYAKAITKTGNIYKSCTVKNNIIKGIFTFTIIAYTFGI